MCRYNVSLATLYRRRRIISCFLVAIILFTSVNFLTILLLRSLICGYLFFFVFFFFFSSRRRHTRYWRDWSSDVCSSDLASAIRDDRAFLFSGISGAGKTTISRLAPADVVLLTDEVSYVRRESTGYYACGTPFAGELARVGTNVSAAVATLFLLEKGSENKIEVVNAADAVRCLLRNILFFAE